MAAPLPGDAPAGEDLRADISPQSLYSSLRDARATARAAERLADNDPAAGPAPVDDWKLIETLAIKALGTRSKDIEIACWLMESLTRLRGLDGFADGANLIAKLIAGFWDQGLFPAADEEDPEGRLVAISGLAGTDRDGSLLQPLRATVLFEREDGTPITLWHYERARDVAALGEQAARQQRGAAGILPFADIENSAHHHGRAALAEFSRLVTRAAVAWHGLETVSASVVTGEGAPATGRVRNVLDAMAKIARRYVPEDAAPAVQAAAAEEGAAEAEDADPTHAQLPPTRDAKLDEVLRIAQAFRISEPGSPFSYTLEEAVRRARLPWPDLLREMLPEHPPRATVLSILGIRPPSD